MLPTQAMPVLMPMPMLTGRSVQAEGIDPVQFGKCRTHAQRRLRRAPRVIVDIERRVPEGHDRVADVLVERALAFEDGNAQGAMQNVEESDRLLRREGLAQGREVPDIMNSTVMSG